jgi:hypothetical protein
MSAVRERLIEKIKRMPEQELKQMLDLSNHLEEAGERVAMINKLMKDRTIRIPKNLSPRFKPVEPLKGKGISASKLLIADRK